MHRNPPAAGVATMPRPYDPARPYGPDEGPLGTEAHLRVPRRYGPPIATTRPRVCLFAMVPKLLWFGGPALALAGAGEDPVAAVAVAVALPATLALLAALVRRGRGLAVTPTYVLVRRLWVWQPVDRRTLVGATRWTLASATGEETLLRGPLRVDRVRFESAPAPARPRLGLAISRGTVTGTYAPHAVLDRLVTVAPQVRHAETDYTAGLAGVCDRVWDFVMTLEYLALVVRAVVWLIKLPFRLL